MMNWLFDCGRDQRFNLSSTRTLVHFAFFFNPNIAVSGI